MNGCGSGSCSASLSLRRRKIDNFRSDFNKRNPLTSSLSKRIFGLQPGGKTGMPNSYDNEAIAAYVKQVDQMQDIEYWGAPIPVENLKEESKLQESPELV